MAAHGGDLPVQSMQDLRYMDSVMKESQRMNPGNLSKNKLGQQEATPASLTHTQRDSYATSPNQSA